jgi:cell division septal protein FtsQ
MPAFENRQPSRPTNVRRTNAKQRKRQHVLDVNVRAEKRTFHRNQQVVNALCIALIVVGLSVAVYYGASKAAARLFFQNPDYDLAVLDVQTDGVLPQDAILAAADLRKGINIMKVDLERARARLSSLPEVEKVQVTRQLPNRVSIQINERKPIAWVAAEHAPALRAEVMAAKNSYLVDANGILIPPRRPSPQDAYLPIIRHYTGPVAPGQEADGEEIHAALDLLHAQQDSLIGARYQIEEIDLGKPYGIIVTDRAGAQITLPFEDMDKQLKRMDTVFQAVESRGQKVQTMNLLVQNNVPVTYRPEPTPEPPAEGSPAPSPSPASSPSKSGGKKEKASESKRRSKSERESKSERRKEKPPERPKHAEKPVERHAEPSKPKPAPVSAPAPAPPPMQPGAAPLQPFQ